MWLSGFVNFLYNVARNVVNACLALTVILVVIDVAWRNIAGGGLQGTVEISEYFLVVIGFFGIFQTHHDNGHITVDLLFERMSRRVKRIVQYVNNLLILTFSLFFMYSGIERFWSAFQAGETNWFGSHVLPVWILRIIVPLGFLFLGIQSLVNISKLNRNNEPVR